MKKCSRCQTLKDELYYHKNKRHKDGLDNYCKSCSKEYKSKSIATANYHKNYRENNREKAVQYSRQYYSQNKDIILSKNVKYYKNRRQKDLKFKILTNLRRRFNLAVKNRSESIKNLIGCDIEFFIDYISQKFENGMSWNNYGKWHIDHIRPCASFDLTDVEQQKICFNYKNLQPLWAEDNLSKGDKWIN